MSEQEQSQKPRSERLLKQRLLCCDHAKDLIVSAERILSGDPPKPNIAFHLILLALEEIGKSGLLTSREVSKENRSVGWIEKHLDDHGFKLLWGLWSPTFSTNHEVDPAKFQQLKEFSEKAHQQRLAGLYVDTEADEGGLTAPSDAVSLEDATSLLAVAKQNLELTLAEDSPDLEVPDELSHWFWEVISDDTKRQRLFSASFIAKYSEFKGNARAWISWAKEEFAKIKQQEQELLAAELSRVTDGNAPWKNRWRLNMRVFCISHSIRQSVLNAWNDQVPVAKLKFVTSGEIRLELTLSDHIKISDVIPSGQPMSKMLLAALNAGSAGYFWHELPKTTAQYFEKIEDLENPQMKVESSGGFDLKRQWLSAENGGRLTLLQEKFLDNAAKCALMFMQMKEEDAAPIFGPYLSGMTIWGKSDAFLSLDQQAFLTFTTALQNALKHFGDWDGEKESLISSLHKALAEMVPEEKHRNIMFRHLLEPPKPPQEMQEYTVSAKRLVDLYLTQTAHRQWNIGKAPSP